MKIFFKKTIVWVVIIFLLSCVFRIFFLNLIEFKSDEATTVYQTVRFFEQPYLIERGLISGTGVYNFPLFNYLIIVPGIFSRDPQFLSFLIALTNSALVSVFFLMIKKYYGFMTALFASLLLAFSPWAVIFSRKIWAQDLINLSFIPFLWFLHELIFRKNTKAVLPLFLTLVLLIQLHGSGLFLSVVTVLLLIVLRIPVNMRKAGYGILIGLIPSIPYFLFQFTNSCPDCTALFKYKDASRSFDFNNLLRPFQVISSSGYHFILGKSYSDFSALFPFANYLKYSYVLGALIIFMGVVTIIFKKRKYLFLVLYFLTIPVLYFATKTAGYMHYFVIMIPISSLLFAISLSSFYTFFKNKVLKSLVIICFVLFMFSNIIFIAAFYSFLSVKKDIEGDYGPIYSFSKSKIEKEIYSYKDLSYYNELRSYAYIYAESNNLHPKLGEFFLGKGSVELAVIEFKK